jgi:hypothetical protein
MNTLHLVPTPKSVTPGNGTFPLPDNLWIVLSPEARNGADANPGALFAAERFLLDAEPLTGTDFHLAAGGGVNPAREIRVRLDPAAVSAAPEKVRPQAYRLTIASSGIEIAAGGAPGIFYAFQTLLQLIRQAAFSRLPARGKKNKQPAPLALPALTITDFPDFPRRGVYHDTARGKVPKVETLLQLVDDLGHLKINEFQLYIENNYEFRKHPDMYSDTTPLTAEELLLIDSACRLRHIDFVPSLTSLGHFEKILCRPTYRALAEAEPAELKKINATCWYEAAPWSLCCTDEGAKTLLKEMYDEFVPNFSSPQFNICCDESYDIGVIRSKEYADTLGGPGHLYVEWIGYCNRLAKAHGKSIQMWGDIILKYPDLISKLPDDAVLLEWGYEHDHKFDEHCATFAERLGIAPGSRPSAQDSKLKTQNSNARTFYVAPGTSSWITLTARVKNAFGNIHAAAESGLRHGAAGILVTDWGDYGHQQMLAVSLLPFCYGAAASWNLQATPNPYAAPTTQDSGLRTQDLSSFLRAVSLQHFQDPAGEFATLAYELGLTYERMGWQRFNASVDWYLFREVFDFANYVNRVAPKDLQRVMKITEKLAQEFESADILHPDSEQIRAELVFTCDEVLHACKRTLVRQAWLAADPAKRNPEEPTLRTKKPKPLPPTFKQDLKSLGTEIKKLHLRFKDLWRARNKESRLADISAEFNRLEREYAQFAKSPNPATPSPKPAPEPEVQPT